jgi:peptidoglycan/xylan/chitin deacetylase (PgdA/CDA1 family)
MIVVASWDDGSVDDLRMADLMAKYNIPATFYWPSMLGRHKFMGRAKGWLTEAQCKEIASRFTVGSHSATHQPMRKMSVEQVANEISNSRKHWQDVTGQPVEGFAYPKDSMTGLVKALLGGAGYKHARTSIVGLLSTGDDPLQTPCTVQIGVNRVEYQEKSWVMYADEMLAKAEEASIFHLFGNSWEVDEIGGWDNLEALLRQIAARK